MQFEVVNSNSSPPYPAGVPVFNSGIDFAQRLAALRKEKGFSRQHLAKRASFPVQPLKGYEAGTSQPTLDVIGNLATALRLSAGELLFGRDQVGHGGRDDFPRLQFKAAAVSTPVKDKSFAVCLTGIAAAAPGNGGSK